jgi:hypothetical protein
MNDAMNVNLEMILIIVSVRSVYIYSRDKSAVKESKALSISFQEI